MSAEVFNPLVRIDCRRISDDETLHDTFAGIFGFPAFYGRNWNAWIDCMTSLDEEPASAMSKFSMATGAIVTLHLDNFSDAGPAAASTWRTLISCAAFVNHRRIMAGEPPILALSYRENEPQ